MRRPPDDGGSSQVERGEATAGGGERCAHRATCGSSSVTPLERNTKFERALRESVAFAYGRRELADLRRLKAVLWAAGFPDPNPRRPARRRRRGRCARAGRSLAGLVPAGPDSYGTHHHHSGGAPHGVHRRTALPERLVEPSSPRRPRRPTKRSRAVRDPRRPLIGIHITAPAEEIVEAPREPRPAMGHSTAAASPRSTGRRAATAEDGGIYSAQGGTMRAPATVARAPAGSTTTASNGAAPGFAIANSRPAGMTSAPPPRRARSCRRSPPRPRPRARRRSPRGRACAAETRCRGRGTAATRSSRSTRGWAMRGRSHGCPRRRTGGAADLVITGIGGLLRDRVLSAADSTLR